MYRIRSPKFSIPIFTCRDGLRFATPEVVARYRARRLKTDILADISCGIGGQAVFFARECRHVYGIDLDGDKLECARKNAGLYGIDNITFIEGDALSPRVIAQVADAGIIFSDPARPPAEKTRQILSLSPGLPMVMDAYKDITNRFAFEAPPQMTPERIDFDCEREYLSVDGKLNRLTLYFGPLKLCETSAVVLEGDDFYRLESGSLIKASELIILDEPETYAFEPDPAVVKAGLLGELAAGLDHMAAFVPMDAKRGLLTSETPLNSTFFRNRYKILGRLSLDCSRINRFLMENDIGKAVIRFKAAPDRYWDVRNTIESGLTGKKVAHLFKKAGLVYICERL